MLTTHVRECIAYIYIINNSYIYFTNNLIYTLISDLDAKQFGDEGYGAKANKVLSTVKGKDFRHEKTKRKRGNYRCGGITLESNSFKYDDDA